MVQRLDSVMAAYQGLNWNATVIIGKGDHILYRKAIGFADVANKIPLKEETFLASASVGKMFTATRILQLVGQGKLNLQGTLKQYLPQWNIKGADSITLHHLLTHTSGLASAWDHPDYDFKKNYSPLQFQKMAEEVPLVFDTPGKSYYYSNIGFYLLGEIIAKVDRMPYAKVIEKYIFAPAGINPVEQIEQAGQIAIPYYQVSSTRFIEDREQEISRIAPGDGSGGWILNAQQLYKFLETYQKGKYLSKEAMDIQRTANHHYNGMERNYRYGLALLAPNFKTPKAIFGHNGGGKGFTAEGFFDPASGYTVVMFSNQYGTGYSLTTNLFRVLSGEEIVPSKPLAYIRLIEHLYNRGDEYVTNNTADFFAEIELKPTEFLLSQAFDILQLDKDYQHAKTIAKIGRQIFPTKIGQWLNSADNALKLGEKERAREFYLHAKKLSEEQNDAMSLKAIAVHMSNL
ncbi:serine hydrolase domain-containing protein [Pedobacter sp.]|uniref:serine hydrolase domain-containing protein n=1 Tax=Pedobacter sp. TaxID=1411316 RepID=UPI00396C9E20